MAEISRYGFVRHFRSEANFHVIRFRKGRVLQTGRGLAFWFRPDGASIAQIPMDDRDMPFLFKGRTEDYQEATVQGTITWRVADPDALGRRVDFSVDLKTGQYLRKPLDRIAGLLTGLARQLASRYLGEHPIDGLQRAGLAPLQARIEDGIAAAESLRAMGLEILAVRIADLAPTAELDRAMQTPTFEALQQKADEA
ncbi:MAG: SPFH domain-containing protein, partial [Inquilinus sp.]|nr:SPFH domain-containing protein [Inquilinus sp.]